MSIRSGQTVTVDFTTRNASSGSAVNADSAPTGILVVTGNDNAAAVTVTNITTGRYKASVTLPTLAIGDFAQIVVTATVGGITDSSGVWTDTCDLSLNSSGIVGADLQTIKTQAVTAAAAVTFPASIGTSTLGGTAQSGDAYAIVNSGTYGNAALLAAIGNLNNLSALANLFGPLQLEVPATATIAYPFKVVIKTTEGLLEDLASSPTIAVTNAAGTDRSSNLSAVSHPSTGVYTFTYTVAVGAAQEGLSFDASGTTASDSTARHAYGAASVVAVDTTTTLAAVKAKTDLIGTSSVLPTTPPAGYNASNAVLNSAQSFTNSQSANQGANITDLIPGRLVMTGGKVWTLDSNGNAMVGLSSQDVRDAMTLAPSSGSPADGSIDADLAGISVSISGVTGGAFTIGVSFVDESGVGVPLVPYSLYGSGGALIGTGKAATDGTTSLALNAGTYSISGATTNLVSFPPTTFTVSANATLSPIVGNTTMIPGSPTLGDVNVFGYTLDQSGAPMVGVAVYLQLVNPGQAILSGNPVKKLSGAGGYFSFSVPQNQQFKYGFGTPQKMAGPVSAGSGSTYQIPATVGQY